jgi:hypothetical protein
LLFYKCIKEGPNHNTLEFKECRVGVAGTPTIESETLKKTNQLDLSKMFKRIIIK